MKIKSIQLSNWQAHADLKLDFHDDINVISGYSNVGKSCIRRAIAWVCFNENISEKDYRRENTSETSVKIELDNEFIIERIRSNSLNRYILSKEGCEDQVFDSFGREIPEEILDVLQINTIDIDNEKLNLNIAEQLTLPFLLDKPASLRAKLFNKLTGNEVLDKLFKEFNKESLRVNREIKETDVSLTKQEEELSEYSIKYKSLKQKLITVQEHYKKIKDDIVIYEQLKELSEKLKSNKEGQEFVAFKKAQIKTVSDKRIKELRDKADEFKKIQNLANELEAINNEIAYAKKQKIVVPKVNFEELKTTNESLQILKQLHDQSLQVNKNQEEVTIQTQRIKELVSNTEKELNELWEKCSVCPLCGETKNK